MQRHPFSKTVGAVVRSAWKLYPRTILAGLGLALIAALMQAAAPKLMQQIIDLLVEQPSVEALTTPLARQ